MGRVVVYGSVTMEYKFEVQEWPRPGKSIQGTLYGSLGGKGLYQAVACSRWGSQTALVSAIGDDIYGKEVLRRLEQEDIQPILYTVTVDRRKGAGTEVAGVIEQGTESCTIGCRSATDKITGEFVEQDAREAVAAADAILITFDASLSGAQRLIDIASASERKLPVVVNASPATAMPLEYLSKVRYVISTAKEARDWLALTDPSFDGNLAGRTPKDAAKEVGLRLAMHSPRAVVLILDEEEEDGCLVVDHKRNVRHYKPYAVPSRLGKAGERSGFCAGLTAALAMKPTATDADEAELIAFASAGRYYALLAPGDWEALPNEHTIKRFIAEHPPLEVEESKAKGGGLRPGGRD